MKIVQKIAKNTSMLFVSQIIGYLLAFFYTIYIARYLGAEGFGVLSFALAFCSIFGVLADLGLSTFTIREIARDKSLGKKYLGNFIWIKIILSLFTFFLVALIINLAGYSQQTVQVVYFIALYVIFIAFAQLFYYSIFQAHELMEYQSIGQLINNVLLFAGLLIGITYRFELIYFAIIYAAVGLVFLIYSFAIGAWKFYLPSLEFDQVFLRYAIIQAVPLSIASIFSIIAFKVDTVILSLIQGNLAVGWYNAAYKIIEFLLFVPTVYNAAVFPVLSKLYVSSKESLEVLYLRSFKYLFIIGLPIAAGITILANKIILLMYQTSFVESIIALQILIWTIPILFLSVSFAGLLIAINKERLVLKIIFISMVFNIAANIVFIPAFSYIAASIITVLTELLTFAIAFHYLSKFVYKIQLHRVVLKPVIATAIMSLFILWFVNLNLVLLIFISSLLYFAILILIKAFSKEDVDLVRKLI